MSQRTKHTSDGRKSSRPSGHVLNPNLTRRGLFAAAGLAGLAATTPVPALAWSSWTNATSPVLKKIGMGDCVHEDLVQIAYARMVRSHAQDATKPDSLLNPWAGALQSDARYATIAGDTVDAGEGSTFASADDLAARLFRENLAYLRIGSFWNDAASNTLLDFGNSCVNAKSIPAFSGNNYYEGAWDVGQHIWETNQQNESRMINGLDALVQFTMNDRCAFIHGMLGSTANHSGFLKQSEVKRFALQWLGVAYEYARTGRVTATSDVSQDQAQKIFKGFIDTYGQLDENAHGMCVSLKVGSSEASIKLPHRRLRLRALGMMCHTLEDFWCPAHTCRTYHSGGGVPNNAILAFSNYELQNGTKPPMFGYHIPFDRYAVSDAQNATNWREALTRGAGSYKGSETLANVLDGGMSCLDSAHTTFNTLGMNESIACITRLFEFMYQGTSWDGGVRSWVDTEVMPTYFDANGQSYICDAGRRSLHTPTFIIAPLKELKRAFDVAGIASAYDEALAAAKSYDAWQRGAHSFFSGKYNTSQSKYVKAGFEGDAIWDDKTGEARLVDLVNKLHAGYAGLSDEMRGALLAKAGCNGCHGMLNVLVRVRGMLQEFSIDLTGSLRADGDDALKKLRELHAFFETGVKGSAAQVGTQALQGEALIAAQDDAADDYDEYFTTSDMAIEEFVELENGAWIIAARDMESLDTAIMLVPPQTPGKDKLGRGIASLSFTYALQTEYEDDPDYLYVVSKIDYVDGQDDLFYLSATVKSVSADRKHLVLDYYGLHDIEMSVLPGVTDLPEVGTYICARYTGGMEFKGYDELYDPGELTKVTYPVEEVAGSRLWLLTNADHPEDGYPDYLVIEYGQADVYTIPRVGQEITVFYHDEVYGDTTDVDEHALATAVDGVGDAPTVYAADADDDLSDSSDAGYLDFGDEYGELAYGNEIFHVANLIGVPRDFSDDPSDVEGDGWHQAGTGSWYYLKDGKRVTGWMQDENSGCWFHFGADGTMSTGWFRDADAAWYYLNTAHDGSYGAALTGWQRIGGTWYLFSSKHDGSFGKMLTGWQKSDGLWYYLNEAEGSSQGAMLTGWVQLQGSWYYLRENVGAPLGSLVVDGTTPDGSHVDASGRWIQ